MGEIWNEKVNMPPLKKGIELDVTCRNSPTYTINKQVKPIAHLIIKITRMVNNYQTEVVFLK